MQKIRKYYLGVLLAIAIQCTDGQWCNETTTRQEVRTVWYTETVTKQKDTFWCKLRFNRKKTKCQTQKQQVRQRQEPYEETIIIPKCCSGYEERRPTAASEQFICTPVCEPRCIYSDCVEPNVCRCLPGFMRLRRGELVDNVCQPCDCPFGYCSDGQCLCHDGYKKGALDDDVCKPHCDMDCESGRCSAPNVCEPVTTTEKMTSAPTIRDKASLILSETTTERPIEITSTETTRIETTEDGNKEADKLAYSKSNWSTSNSDSISTTANIVEDLATESTEVLFPSTTEIAASSSDFPTTESISPSSSDGDYSAESPEEDTRVTNTVLKDNSDGLSIGHNRTLSVENESGNGMRNLWIIVAASIISCLIVINVVIWKLTRKRKLYGVNDTSENSSVQYFSHQLED